MFKRVMQVDDDADMRFLTSLCLEDFPLVLQQCATPQEALDQVAAFRPDLLLVDFYMPGMDGLTLVEQLRQRGITTPAILITGNLVHENTYDAAATGIIGSIIKPFDVLSFYAQLQTIWRAAGYK